MTEPTTGSPDMHGYSTPIQPWSTRISASWRTTLRFYERRYEILREIEDRIGIAAYRHEEDVVGARLPGSACEVELRPGGLSLRARNPVADVEQLMAAGTIMLKGMDHPRLTDCTARVQHVMPLDSEFAAAVEHSIANVFRGWVARAGMFDYSILYDGTLRGRHYQAEFGVAAGEELAMRLAGWVSRAGPPVTESEADPMEGPPPAALYVDSYWSHDPDPDETPIFDLDDYYSEVVLAANEVAEALMESVSPKEGPA